MDDHKPHQEYPAIPDDEDAASTGAPITDAEHPDCQNNPEADGYEVGYKRPPKETRFKKGQSGNPNGRPKGVNNLTTDVQATLKTPVAINENGKRRKASTQRAVLLRLREKALSGDAKAIDRLIALASSFNNPDGPASNAEPLNADDQEILDDYVRRRSYPTAEGSHDE